MSVDVIWSVLTPLLTLPLPVAVGFTLPPSDILGGIRIRGGALQMAHGHNGVIHPTCRSMNLFTAVMSVISPHELGHRDVVAVDDLHLQVEGPRLAIRRLGEPCCL